MAKISKEGLRDLVYKELHKMIENSRFTPGVRINVEKLTKELGVSRTPVWQAIGVLEKEGLLHYVQNVGVFIQELSPEEAVELYTVREVLECLAAELAVKHITNKDLQELSDNLASQKIVIASRDLIGYSKLDFDFHATVYRSCHNSYLIELLDTIKRKMRPLVNHLDEILGELHEDHNEIYEALVEKNSRKAVRAFRNHNRRMRKHIEREHTKVKQ